MQANAIVAPWSSTAVIAPPVIAEVFYLLSEASGRIYASGLTRGRAPMGAIGAIRACRESEKVSPEQENEVGLLVAEELGKLLDAIGWSWGATRTMVKGGVLWFGDVAPGDRGREGDHAKILAEEAEPRERSGRLLAADALCELLDELNAPSAPTRETSAEKWRTWQASDKGRAAREALWSSWLPPKREDGEAPPRLHAYSASNARRCRKRRPTANGEQRTFYATPEASPKVHQAVAKAVILRWSKARTGFVPATVTVNDNQYAGMEKIGTSIAWAIGAPGEAVVVDGVTFAGSPVTRYAPRIERVTNGGLPAERTLGLEVETDPSGLLAIALDSLAVLRPLAGKLAAALLSMPGERSGALGELTRVLHPDQRIQRRDYEAVAEALSQLASLRVVFHDDTVSQLFDIRHPRAEPSPEQLVATSLGVGVRAEIQKTANAWLRGAALVNFDGMMRMPAKHTLHRRLYLLAAGDWNDAQMTRQYRPRMLAEWSARANLLKGNATAKAKSAAGEDVLDAARSLADDGLIIIEEGGVRGRRELTIKPTAEHLEAYRKSREGGRR